MARPKATRTARELAFICELLSPGQWAPGSFGIAIDTREQKPLPIPGHVAVEVKKLDAGDYALLGYEDRCVVERKSLSDFIGSITHGRERFARELVLLSKFEWAAIFVEASISDVWYRRYFQQITPASVMGTIASISVKHRVPVFFVGPRAAAADLVERTLRQFFDLKIAGKDDGRE